MSSEIEPDAFRRILSREYIKKVRREKDITESHDKDVLDDDLILDGNDEVPPALESVTEATGEDEASGLEILDCTSIPLAESTTTTPPIPHLLLHQHQSLLDEEEESNVSSDDRQTVVVGPPTEASKSSCIPLVVSAASKWRAAAEMGDQAANPNWRRAAVRAVQLQDTTKLNGSLKHTEAIPPPPQPSQPGGVIPHPPGPPGGITPPPGPWGDKVFHLDPNTSTLHHAAPPPTTSAATVHVDMGKVVGVLRTTHTVAVNQTDHEDEDDSTYEENTIGTNSRQEEDHDQDAAACATCAAASEATKTKAKSAENLDEASLCGDPLMYATFVAPVHQYSTETEPSRQASFNYPSRQPSFKQNSSEADAGSHGSQSLLNVPCSSATGPGLRTSLTPDRGLSQQPDPSSSTTTAPPPPPILHLDQDDEVQDIYAEVPPECWPLPPVPPQHCHTTTNAVLLSSSEMQKSNFGQHVDQECLEISQEELERQVQMERLSFISGSSANEEEDEEEEDEEEEDDDDPMAALLPPPPLPPKPALLLNQQGQRIMMAAVEGSRREATPMMHPSTAAMPFGVGKHFHYADDDQLSTIRRRSKRDRNRTLGAPDELPDAPMIRDPNKPTRVSKSRSKSRSPGRPIEEDRGGGSVVGGVGSLRSSVGVHGHRTSSSRGNSPDNISESSASFHENELIQPAVPPHFRVVPSSSSHPHHSNVVPPQMVHQGSSSSSASAAAVANNPWLPQYANRDSVRESWISSGSSDHPYHVHRYQHYQHQRVVPAQVSSGGTSDASNKSLASSGGGGGGAGTGSTPHQTLIQRPMHPQQQQQQSQITSKMTGTLPRGTRMVTSSSVTLPRSSKATGGNHHPHPTASHKNMYQSRPVGPPSAVAQPPLQTAGMRSTAGSRESGSSSSRTVSRSGSRCALSKSGSRSGSSSALQKARPGTPEELERRSPTLEFPNWMQQPSIGLSDLTNLECMAIPTKESSEVSAKVEAVLSNIQQRYKKDQIYTNIGTVLLSINPHKKLPLYTPDAIDIYRCHCLYELPPHIYAVTDRAWRSLRDMNTDQCVLFSGESGSGKTEAMKLSLQYLTAITGHAREFHQTKYQILQSNIILESFGNARTRLNDNSSRFGKYMEVSFDFKGDPTGAHITNYLLEKSRVTRYPKGERNFHIFYQLLAGADIQLLKDLRLQRNIDNYTIIRRCLSSFSSSKSSTASSTTSPSSSKMGKMDSSDSNLVDRTEFLITRKAMEDLGFHPEEIIDIFRIMSAVLKLGNINFIPTTNMDGTDGCAISNDYEVHDLCHCLRTSYDKLKQVLLVRTIQLAGNSNSKSKMMEAATSSTSINSNIIINTAATTARSSESISSATGLSPTAELYDVCEILRGEFPSMQAGLTTRSLESARSDYLVTDLSVGEASAARDALCRTLYSRLFTWLVSRINEAVKMKTPRKYKTLGLLDLYGFESLVEDPGGFEQLVFNFAAEKVQRVTLEWTMVLEQQEYAMEGVEWTHLNFLDNGQVVTMLERGSYGVFSILEEVCMSSNNIVMSTQQPSSTAAKTHCGNAGEDADLETSGASTPSLMIVSPDDIFLERLAERFGNHPCVEVKTSAGMLAPNEAGYSSNTTAPVTSASEDTSTPEVVGNQQEQQQQQPPSKQISDSPTAQTLCPSVGPASSSSDKLPHHCFRIKHYGRTVTYDVRDFVSRNRDALDRELSQAMYECDHPILKVLFPEGNPRRSARRRPATAGTQFKISLGALLNNLGAKNPHYVRCIRPNDSKQPKNFDASFVKHQITYQGLVDWALLRRHGYVFRMEYEAFLARYKMLSVHTWPHWTAGGFVDGVTCLLRDLPISANEYAFGRTKIFIRTSKTHEILEELRRERIDELATLIQKIFRGFDCRLKLRKLQDSQMVIANCWKRWKDKSHITEIKQRRHEEWAINIVQKCFRLWQKRRFLLVLAHNLPSESPLSKEWPNAPKRLREANVLLRRLYHQWRCQRYRHRFDQIARNRMREKVTASIIFKNRKASYPKSVSMPFYGDYIGLRRNPAWREILKRNRLHKMDQRIVFADILNKMNRSNGKGPIAYFFDCSIGHPFLGDYVRLRQNPQWKKICVASNDQYVVFADIINKITRTGGKFVPILFVISTSSMLIMDQRTMQIKYRIPAAEIFKLSLSPYHDDIAVFHVRATSPTRELRSQPNVVPGCLSSEGIKRKGDFVFQTGHVIEIVTKLFLVVQNATGKPPHVNIATEFEANFGAGSVNFNFKRSNQPASALTSMTSSDHHHSHHGPTHVKLVKRGNKIDIFL